MIIFTPSVYSLYPVYLSFHPILDHCIYFFNPTKFRVGSPPQKKMPIFMGPSSFVWSTYYGSQAWGELNVTLQQLSNFLVPQLQVGLMLSSSCSNFVWPKLVYGFSILSRPLWAHMCNSPVMCWNNFLVFILHCLWVSQSFSLVQYSLSLQLGCYIHVTLGLCTPHSVLIKYFLIFWEFHTMYHDHFQFLFMNPTLPSYLLEFIMYFYYSYDVSLLLHFWHFILISFRSPPMFSSPLTIHPTACSLSRLFSI